jgi:hypothetical protein
MPCELIVTEQCLDPSGTRPGKNAREYFYEHCKAHIRKNNAPSESLARGIRAMLRTKTSLRTE